MTALVTGAGKRIGRAIAIHLARLGHDVVVHHSASKADAEGTVALIRGLGGRAECIGADFLDETETATLIERSRNIFGPLTVLVNNASIFEEDTLLTATEESWNRHMRSNLRAPFVLTQCFARQVSGPAGFASIINMVDQRVLKLTPQFMSYTLAKSALWTLTRTAAQALAPRIRVNAIGPGPTLQGARQTHEDFLTQCDATLLRRGGSPDEVTTALSYLLSAPGVTGQIICPDSGQHLAWQTPDVLGVE